jgi:hypothetical protein
MIIRYNHNTDNETPIIKGLADLIKKKYNAKIIINQYKPRNPYFNLYAMITEIEIPENPRLNGKLDLIIEHIEKEWNLQKK